MESLEIGIDHYKKGRFEEALQVFNQLIASAGPQPEHLHYRARIQSRLGALDQAINDFDTLIGLDPYNTTFISDRAVVLHLLKRNEEAMQAFDQALNLDPNNPYRYSSRAYFRDRIGDLKGAIEDYEQAIALDPEDAISLNNKGLVEEKLGYQAASRKSFSEADRLTGYSPSQHKQPEKDRAESKIGNDASGPIAPQEAAPEKSKSLSVKHFFMILNKLVTDKATRKEFTDFIRSTFKGA